MTWDEFQIWGAYVEKRGTLNLGMRMEWLMARQALMINSACGGEKKFRDFIRFHDESPQEPKVASAQDQARMFATMMNAGKK